MNIYKLYKKMTEIFDQLNRMLKSTALKMMIQIKH